MISTNNNLCAGQIFISWLQNSIKIKCILIQEPNYLFRIYCVINTYVSQHEHDINTREKNSVHENDKNARE